MKCKPLSYKARFGKLIIISEPIFKTVTNGNRRRSYYKCQCDCGNIKLIERSQLTGGKTKSCGCLLAEINRIIHGNLDGVASFNALFSQYKIGAKNRGYNFELTREQFIGIIVKNCFYCGSEAIPYNRYVDSNGRNLKINVNADNISRSWIKANTIDRLDNAVGYIFNNCVPCCLECNEMKLDRTKEAFIAHSNKITKFQENKK